MTTRDQEPGAFCPDRRDDIIVYICGEMGPGAAEAFEAHLASCEGCRLEVDSLRRPSSRSAMPAPSSRGAPSAAGQGATWEEEWTILRRRLLAVEEFPPEETAATVIPSRRGARRGSGSGARRRPPRCWPPS